MNRAIQKIRICKTEEMGKHNKWVNTNKIYHIQQCVSDKYHKSLSVCVGFIPANPANSIPLVAIQGPDTGESFCILSLRLRSIWSFLGNHCVLESKQSKKSNLLREHGVLSLILINWTRQYNLNYCFSSNIFWAPSGTYQERTTNSTPGGSQEAMQCYKSNLGYCACTDMHSSLLCTAFYAQP